MRVFEDEGGRLWDAAVAQESYGSLVLIFAPRQGGEIRKVQLEASTQVEAEAELVAMTDEQLRGRLQHAPAWSG